MKIRALLAAIAATGLAALVSNEAVASTNVAPTMSATTMQDANDLATSAVATTLKMQFAKTAADKQYADPEAVGIGASTTSAMENIGKTSMQSSEPTVEQIFSTMAARAAPIMVNTTTNAAATATQYTQSLLAGTTVPNTEIGGDAGLADLSATTQNSTTAAKKSFGITVAMAARAAPAMQSNSMIMANTASA